MTNHENSNPSQATSSGDHIAELGVSSSAVSRPNRFLSLLYNGALWAIVFGVLAYLYGMYDAATAAKGNAWLWVSAGTTISLVVLLWHHQRSAALLIYEFGVSAIWIGYFLGSVRFSIFIDGEWFGRVCLLWIGSAAIGGTIVGGRHERSPRSAVARTTRTVALVTLVVAAGLLACGFTSLLLENRPIAAFCALRTFSLKGVAFSPDGDTLATIGGFCGEERVVKFWDATTGKQKATSIEEPDEHDPQCAAIQFTDGTPMLAVASVSRQTGVGKLPIRIWNTMTGQVQHCFYWDDGRKPAFSRNGKSLVYVAGNGHVRVFDLQSGQVASDLARNRDDVGCLAVTTECDVLACVTDEPKLEIWDVADERQRRVTNIDKKISSMDFSPDGRLLACGTEDGCVEVIDVGAGRRATLISCFHDGSVDAVAFSPNGAMLVCGGGQQGFTRVLDTNRWKIVATLRTWGGWRTFCFAFSADGKRLATGDALTRVAIWDVPSLKLEP